MRLRKTCFFSSRHCKKQRKNYRFFVIFYATPRIFISKEVQRSVKSGEIESAVFQKRYLHKKGHIFWGKVSNSIVKDHDGEPLYFVTHFVDVTENKRILDEFQTHQNDLESIVKERTKELFKTNEALRESEEKYRVLFNTFPLGISISDESGNILEANDKSTELLGISRKKTPKANH